VNICGKFFVLEVIKMTLITVSQPAQGFISSLPIEFTQRSLMEKRNIPNRNGVYHVFLQNISATKVEIILLRYF